MWRSLKDRQNVHCSDSLRQDKPQQLSFSYDSIYAIISTVIIDHTGKFLWTAESRGGLAKSETIYLKKVSFSGERKASENEPNETLPFPAG